MSQMPLKVAIFNIEIFIKWSLFRFRNILNNTHSIVVLSKVNSNIYLNAF